MTDFSTVRNLIFDLGGVIINIDPQLTYQAMAKLAGREADQLLAQLREHRLVERLESGQISNEEFLAEARQTLALQGSDEDLRQAWNELLLDLPAERIDRLRELGQHYRVFLLSNTNAFHIPTVERILHEATHVQTLDELFEKAYYSYQVGYIKPDAAIFQFVLEDSQLNAEETVFIDDSFANVQAAEQLGIRTIHVQPPQTMLDYLKDA
ncbi:putative hydrolase of the HAD superfamily [Catalinimonas alkaloidigena]|uniref:Putative hydrolase of the HAD superfamily n=1 Tax=Catalinimonas alkaloidigena TaxID=1075417 RepID=A0A1G9B344_9BACT|nr:HAD family phosphatase [Catalinimonas alkaloidigena]SDK33979.1 putative hydrolase of the HAD superfamily [Catalinimonas alkaloidigena]